MLHRINTIDSCIVFWTLAAGLIGLVCFARQNSTGDKDAPLYLLAALFWSALTMMALSWFLSATQGKKK